MEPTGTIHPPASPAVATEPTVTMPAGAGPSVRSPNPPVTVVVLTLNEEVNIAECLASCDWSDDVHVVDSGSTDRTREIAGKMGARVHQHPFASFGEQRNWAIDHIQARHDWVLHLDADERCTPQFVAALAERLRDHPPEAGFHLPHKVIFMGRWLKRSAGYPTYQMRLFHRQRMRFCDYGHGQRELTDGRVGIIDEPYLHYPFSKGLHDWFEKHNRYSTLEAIQAVAEGSRTFRWSELFFSDRVSRHRAWKALGYRLPFRASLRMLAGVLFYGGLLEGRAGLTYLQLLSAYEHLISLKTRLLFHEARTRPGAGLEFELERRRSQGNTVAVSAPPLHVESAIGRPEGAHQMQPEASPWTFREKLWRAVWMLVGRPIFRMSFHNWYGFRAWLLRRFGARIGRATAIRPTVQVEIPWNLDVDDRATVGDHAILYSLGRIYIGKRTVISQYAHLCAGTHDFTEKHFRLIRGPIAIGDDAWLGADVFVGPNVTIGALSVVGARSSVYKDLPARMVCVGNPARPLKERVLR